MKVIVKKLIEGAEKNLCVLSKEVFNSLSLSEDKVYKLNFGQLREETTIKVKDEEGCNMYFSREIYSRLLLYLNLNLDIWIKEENIYFGPVVGVLVSPRYLEDVALGIPPLSAQKQMQASIAANALSYYFTIENINFPEKKIKGYTFIENQNEWKHAWFPMPNSIYDRGVKFYPEEKLLVKFIREQLGIDKNMNFINSKDYFSKWHTYKYLSKYPEINFYLPKTVLYSSFNDVLFMLKESGFIFIKSSFGSMGRDVLSIELRGNKYVLNFYKDGLTEVLIDDVEELKKQIKTFMVGKSYIVQHGIRLLKFQGRNMDMRILIVKGIDGKWKATHNQCRIAKGKATITNYSAGGDITNYTWIYDELNNSFNKGKLLDFDELEAITCKIAEYIEKEFGNFGEIGMDMAFDENGRVWFIEANTKPDKDPEPGLDDMEEVPPQSLSILEYAKYMMLADTHKD